MENQLTFDRHPPEEVFEEYIFDRLDENLCARFEEHLLACANCCQQLEKEEEYASLMKAAARNLQVAEAPRRPVFQLLRRSAAAAIVGASLLAATFAVAIPHHPGAGHATVSVRLESFRGDPAGSTARARAGSGVDLTIDATDIVEAPPLRLEIVDATGHPVWTGSARAAPGSKILAAHVTQPFRAGVYWVRLYSRGGELLREFGVRAE